MQHFTIHRTQPIYYGSAVRRLAWAEAVMDCLTFVLLTQTLNVTPAKLLATTLQPTLKPCLVPMLTDCGSIVCAAAGSR